MRASSLESKLKPNETRNFLHFVEHRQSIEFRRIYDHDSHFLRLSQDVRHQYSLSCRFNSASCLLLLAYSTLITLCSFESLRKSNAASFFGFPAMNYEKYGAGLSKFPVFANSPIKTCDGIHLVVVSPISAEPADFEPGSVWYSRVAVLTRFIVMPPAITKISRSKEDFAVEKKCLYWSGRRSKNFVKGIAALSDMIVG